MPGAKPRAKTGAKRAMPRAKQAKTRAKQAKTRAKQAKTRAKQAKRYCQPKTPPCCEPAAGRLFLVKSCRQPQVIRVGREISEDDLNGS